MPTASLKSKPASFWRKLPKLQIHEHIDCSLRPRTCVELWAERNFEIAEAGRKAGVAFPEDIVALWRAEGVSASNLTASSRSAFVRKSRAEAVRRYDNWVASFAQESLDNYLAAIIFHVLPLMHDPKNLTRIVRERIEDAVKDGHIGVELRFAPQLHLGEDGTQNTLDEVMQAALAGIKDSPIPVKLILCALRHEDLDMGVKVARLGVKYKRHVGVFDLAASETMFPGVLPWWFEAAQVAIDGGLDLTIHLWETNEPTDEDIRLLKLLDALIAKRQKALGKGKPVRRMRIGHGVRGDRQGDWVIECCPTSNVVTGQYATFADHPIDRLYRAGRRVTINTDGTLFTQVTLSDEYRKIAETFDWKLADFLAANLTALEASTFSAAVKKRFARALFAAYS